MAGFQQGPQAQYEPQILDDTFLVQYRNEIENIYQWLRRAMEARNSPNYAQNGDFVYWGRGTLAAPSLFYRTDTGVTFSRLVGSQPSGIGGAACVAARPGGAPRGGIGRSFPSIGTDYTVLVSVFVVAGKAVVTISDDSPASKSQTVTATGKWVPVILRYATGPGASRITVKCETDHAVPATPSSARFAGLRIFRDRDGYVRGDADPQTDQLSYSLSGRVPTTITRDAAGLLSAVEYEVGTGQKRKLVPARDADGFLLSLTEEYPPGTVVNLTTITRNADKSVASASAV